MIYLEFLGILVRAAMVALGTYLVNNHLASQGQAEALTTQVVHDVVLAAPIVGAVAWSIGRAVGRKLRQGGWL